MEMYNNSLLVTVKGWHKHPPFPNLSNHLAILKEYGILLMCVS
jgi:hypothetical protein